MNGFFNNVVNCPPPLFHYAILWGYNYNIRINITFIRYSIIHAILIKFVLRYRSSVNEFLGFLSYGVSYYLIVQFIGLQR